MASNYIIRVLPQAIEVKRKNSTAFMPEGRPNVVIGI